MQTFRSVLSALIRSPLAWILAVLLPFALGNPAFRATVVLATYATIFATGAVCLSCIALAGLYWIGADIFRGYRGPSLSVLLDRAIGWGCDMLDRIVPAGPTGPLGIPACPTCPFGECATCEVVDAPPVLTPALAADIHAVYARFAGIPCPELPAIPTAAVFSPAPSFVALRAPLARLLPSWEEREASREPIALRPDTSSEQGPAFDAWRHANRGDRFPLFLAPSTPLLTYRPLTIAPLPRVRPDVTSDPCDETDCPLCPVTLASGRHEVEPGTWTAERVQICANGPATPTYPDNRYHLHAEDVVGDMGDKVAEKRDVHPNAPQIAQDAPGTPEPTPEPSSPVDASEEDTMPADLLVGRDRLRKLAKAEGCSYSGKDGADALRAKIRAHRAYRS